MQQILRIAAVLPILAFGASAQEQEAKAKMRFQLGGSLMGPPVKGAPYAADEVTQSTQVLADGTRIHHENRVAVYRDGEGRVRRESSPDQITIMDPVAGASYFLNPKTLTAQKAPVMMHYQVFSPSTGAGLLRTMDSTFAVTTTRDGPSSVFINGAPLDPKLMADALDKAK